MPKIRKDIETQKPIVINIKKAFLCATPIIKISRKNIRFTIQDRSIVFPTLDIKERVLDVIESKGVEFEETAYGFNLNTNYDLTCDDEYVTIVSNCYDYFIE